MIWKIDALIHHLVSIVLFLFRPLVFEGNLSLVVRGAGIGIQRIYFSISPERIERDDYTFDEHVSLFFFSNNVVTLFELSSNIKFNYI